MDFALRQMKNMGWTEGKGLGPDENGIVKPIVPNVQLDTRGLGFSVSDSLHLNNQWWIEAYNAASKGWKPGYKITSVGVIVKPSKLSNDSADDRKKNQVYKQFISAGLMNSNIKKKQTQNKKRKEKLFESIDSSEIKNSECKYLKKSLDFNLIFAKNKDITCHKASRLGIKMTGKMKRLEEQEREFKKGCKN